MRASAANPISWLNSAYTLAHAARTIWKVVAPQYEMKVRPEVSQEQLAAEFRDLGLHGVFYVLAGQALENAAKAVLVAREPSLVGDQGLDLKTWPRHDMLDLLERIGFEIADEHERAFIVRAERHLTWAGRYPVPLDFRRDLPRVDPTRGVVWPQERNVRDDERFESVLERLDALMRKAME